MRTGLTGRERGMILVGIDVIGPYPAEINVTCPTGIREIGRLDGVRLESDVRDAVEQRLGASGRRP